MHVRIRKNGKSSNRSVIACHSVRIGGKPQQIIVKTFGHSSEDSTLQALFCEAKLWVANNKDSWISEHFLSRKAAMEDKKKISIYSLREEKRINVGMEDIFGFLFNELSFNTLLSANHQKTLRQVIMARILEPGSKLRLSKTIEENFDSDNKVDRIYRMMDCLNKEAETIHNMIFQATKRVSNDRISLVLFDVTTLSFESISEDDLRAFGYSKDFKFNTTQITLALATTKEGLPIGYRLFPGNTAESKTLIESITMWRKTFPIEDVTIIGDRAMMSENNISNLDDAGFKYVVAYPLRKLAKKYKDQILNENQYNKTESDKEISRFQVIDFGDRRLCVSYSPKRAHKDAKDRERLVSKLNKKLSSCKNVKRLLNKNGYLKFSTVSGQAVAHIDQDKIAEDARWDGLHGVITNEQEIDISIFEKYRRLWVIEESFRINKHTLKMRPIYHFTPTRIQAHILLCFMVFALMRFAQHKLANAGKSMSAQRIVDALRDVEASILLDTIHEDKYKMLSKLNDDAKYIYDAFNLKTSGLSVVRI